MFKNKLILATLIIILAIGAGLFYFLKNEAQKTDKLSLILNGAKKATSMDLNLAPEKIKWNTEKGEIVLSGKGGMYLDALNSVKIEKLFNNLDVFFKNSGFKNDPNNDDIVEENMLLKKYKNGEVVCNLIKKNNPNSTSSLIFACANFNNTAFSFSSGKGTDCVADSDCGTLTDGCKRERVCRNLKYYFYNNCLNPSQLIKDIDFSTAKCQCVSNQCVPDKVTSPSSSPSK